MKYGGLIAGVTLLASCATLIPEGRAQDSGWTMGTPPQSAPGPAPAPVSSAAGTMSFPAGGSVRGYQAVESARWLRIGEDVEKAVGAGVSPGPSVASLSITNDAATRALTAFKLSCPSLLRRDDLSGLVTPAEWQAPCSVAASWSGKALDFFRSNFDTLQIGTGGAFATGYFEPQITGSRWQGGVYQTPIYGKPTDLIEANLGLFSEEWKGKRIRGRLNGQSLELYDDRTAIEQGSLANRAPVLGWAEDAVDLFFLQVQGSGRVALPDGSVMRIGYASQNGRDYTGIGRVMRERGLLAPGQANMQGIKAWLRANPEQGRAIMRENASYVFFRELTGPGPLGAMGYAVTANTSVAADPRFVPLGAPVWLDMEHDVADGLWVAQDTGGAIKGANRFDTFWGAGERAAVIAGGMSARGQALIFVPRGTYAALSGGQ